MTENAHIEERLLRLERRIGGLGSPVVIGGGMNTVLPPIGKLADFRNDALDPDLSERAERDQLPLPHPDNREGYASHDHFQYWLSGLEDHDKVLEVAREIGIDSGRIFDFGGSTGRIFRHFVCQDEAFDVWTSDFKVASYQWNLAHMPLHVRPFLNTFYPPLPIPDHFFNIITAFSVFTHIDELESPWLLELRRVLSPKGVLCLTIHDELFWEKKPVQLLQTLQRSRDGDGLSEASPFPGDRSAFHFTDESHYSCNVFHSKDYVRRQWGRFFDIVNIGERDHGIQCLVALTYD